MITGFIYLSLTAYTKDALWFYPVFNAQPSVGIIRCYGEQVTLRENDAHLTAIVELVNKQISGDKRWDELNLTNVTYLDYQTSRNVMILELYYDEPQRIHSTSPFFSGFDMLLIPLDGRFASMNIMFSLIRGKPAGGSFHVETFEPVREYITNNAICVKN
ncbi:MAG TPA: hypothetical protein PLF42_08370 [Anaerolineales bacterium]|nr:hypothetical protein [Anaerolineales bacterium]